MIKYDEKTGWFKAVKAKVKVFDWDSLWIRGLTYIMWFVIIVMIILAVKLLTER